MAYFSQDATLRLLEHLRSEGVSIPLCFSPPGPNVDQTRGYRHLRDRRASLTSDINEAIIRRDHFNEDTGTAGNRANYAALVKVRKDADALVRTLAALPYRAGLERRWPSPFSADPSADYVPSLGELQAALRLLAEKAEESARHLSESGLLETDILALAALEQQAARAEYIANLPPAERERAVAVPQIDPAGPIVRPDGRIVATPQAAFLLGLEDAFKEHLVYPADDDDADVMMIAPEEDLTARQLDRKDKLRTWRPTFPTSSKGAPPGPYTSFVMWISAEIGDKPTNASNIRIAHGRIPEAKAG